MTNDSIPTAIGLTREQGGVSEAGEIHEARNECAVAANAAKVLETTRHAWSQASEAPKETARRLPRATKPKKRAVPRQSRWPSLVAALNYWSPKPL
ncbi:hypothetical protein [Caballeronia sp. TF1N1]|uniref:hypothetical protein n=1 Tax=Caballeronia sp. TF1N1 TaxID=2878153 RepID=UPI001FD25DC1|nr:hypothetical protein [Caballeronia sp. TF1N1]